MRGSPQSLAEHTEGARERTVILPDTLELSRSQGGFQNTTLTDWHPTEDQLALALSKAQVGAKDGTYFVRGPTDTESRCDAGMPYATILIIDGDKQITKDGEIVDGCVHPLIGHEALTDLGIRHFIHTSHSHNPEKQFFKFRAVIPCLMLNSDELHAMANWIIEQLHSKDCRVALVNEMTVWSQPWYFPRIRAKSAEFLTYDGFIDDLEPISREQVEAITNAWLEKKPQAAPGAFDGRSSIKDATSPIGRFNQNHDDPEKWRELLVRHGFQLTHTDKVNGAIAWRYVPPNSTTQLPGVHVYRGKHDGALLITSHNGSFELPRKACDYFGLWTHLEHAGDSKAAEEAIGIKPKKKLPEAPAHVTDESSSQIGIWQGWDGAWPDFDQNRLGIIVNATQVRLAIDCPCLIGMAIAYDEFTDTIMVARRPGEWEPINEAIEFEIRMMLERAGFPKTEKQLVHDAIAFVALHHKMDTGLEWIHRLPPHDGVQRLNTFFRDYFGAAHDQYTMAVGRYLWTGLAGRILQPGCKADNVPVLVGPQGIRKSSAVEAMCPSPQSFMILSLAKKDDDISRSLRGIVLGEWGELAGMKKKDVERVKSFCSQTRERWIPKFKEYSATFARRCMFVATTNEEQFLDDPTGNRRFFPIKVTSCDPEAIARDRDQLWAEAVGLFRMNGVEWKGATALGQFAQQDHEAVDPWQSAISDWLTQPVSFSGDGIGANAQRRDLTTEVILREAIQMPIERQDGKAAKRLGEVMRKLGFYRGHGVMIGPYKKGDAWRKPK